MGQNDKWMGQNDKWMRQNDKWTGQKTGQNDNEIASAVMFQVLRVRDILSGAASKCFGPTLSLISPFLWFHHFFSTQVKQTSIV